jgi:hypothetical protein
MREMLERLAGMYEGTRLGGAELRGLSVETPEGPFKLSALRLNLESGKIGEFVFDGLDARTQKGPVKVGRLDRSIAHIRAGSWNGGSRRPAEGVGAGRARQRPAGSILGQSGAGSDSGCANRYRDDGDHAARYRRRRPRGGVLCPHQNVRPDEARRAIVDNIRATSAKMTGPDAGPIADALARFIENPSLGER